MLRKERMTTGLVTSNEQKSKLHKKFARSSITEGMTGSKISSSLDDDIKNSSSLSIFKTSYRNFILISTNLGFVKFTCHCMTILSFVL